MLQIENEDLRDRLGIFEEYTGKDSYLEMAKLVKEKKVLENRVKHLEKTSMYWAAAQFQATKSGFNTSNDNFR
jgi:regulator of replication initiation timing